MKYNIIKFYLLDFIESQVSPVQRNGDLTNTYTKDNFKKK